MPGYSFFFYDLETTGTSPARSRIMQFAGQRTDANLEPIGDAHNYFVKQSPDILPEPEAILLTGILPSECNKKGITEAELAKIFNEQLATKNTIFVGFNNLRFDDEFIRFLNYRNFYDPYQWHWANGCSRWDLLDLVRMTRALRPDGLKWPVVDGKAANKLELLAKENKLDHDSAHDAASDVIATIKLAKLIKDKQPKLFNYLLGYRSKDKLIELITKNEPFVYTSSHYSSEILHTSAVACLSVDKERATALVYDLRYDPSPFISQTTDQLVDNWRYDPLRPRDEQLPFKTIKLNRCPAVAPIGVIDRLTAERLKLDIKLVNKNFELFNNDREIFRVKMPEAIAQLDQSQTERYAQRAVQLKPGPEEKLYDKFTARSDQARFAAARAAAKESAQPPVFSDLRLNELYKLYRSVNYQDQLTTAEEDWFRARINSRLFKPNMDGQTAYSEYQQLLNSYLAQYKNNKQKTKLLNELKSYAQSIENDYVDD